eukprot:366063-Chlamydomonas_euryale.AAC.2
MPPSYPVPQYCHQDAACSPYHPPNLKLSSPHAQPHGPPGHEVQAHVEEADGRVCRSNVPAPGARTAGARAAAADAVHLLQVHSNAHGTRHRT